MPNLVQIDGTVAVIGCWVHTTRDHGPCMNIARVRAWSKDALYCTRQHGSCTWAVYTGDWNTLPVENTLPVFTVREHGLRG